MDPQLEQVKQNKVQQNFIAAGDLESYHESPGASLPAPQYGGENVSQLKSTNDNSSTNSTQKAEGEQGVISQMEGAFGTDFSNVNIHTGSDKPAELGAKAYTTGQDVFMGQGEYQPGTSSGNELLAHELTHVVQQSQGRVNPTTSVNGQAVNDSSTLENEADSVASKVTSGTLSQSSDTVQKKSIQNASGPIQGFGLGSLIKKGFGVVKNVTKSAAKAAKKALGSAGNAVGHAVKGIGNGAKSILKGVASSGKKLAKGIFSGGKQILNGISKGVKGAAGGVLGGIKTAATGIKNGIGQAGQGIMEGASKAKSGILDGASQIFSNPLGGIKSAIGGIAGGARSVAGGILGGIKSGIGGVASGVKESLSGIVGGLKSMGSGLWNGLKDVAGGAWGAIKEMGGAVKDAALEGLGGLLKAGYSLVDAALELGPGFLEELIGPEGEEVEGEEIPAEHISMEYIAHHIAYNPSSLKDKTKSAPLEAAGYDIDNYSIRVGPNGFQAVLIMPKSNSEGLKPILAFRGTLSFQGVSTDLDTQQVGHHQYNANEQEINELVARAGGKVDVTGHSLGGAMAQIFTARNPGLVNNLVTFQSPGISAEEVDAGNERISELDEKDRPNIAHHIMDNDLVDTAGEKNLTGTVYEHNMNSGMDPLEAHTSFIFHTPEFKERREQLGIDDNVINAIGAEVRTQNAEITKYDDHPNVVRRVVYELVRKGVGLGTRSIRKLLRDIQFEKLFSGEEYEDYDSKPS